MHLSGYNKWILCLAVCLLSVIILTKTLCLVYPRMIYELDTVYKPGSRYSVRTYRKKDSGAAYFEVLRGHRRLYSCSGEVRFSVEMSGSDITGNGVPNLVIRQFQGSAHGDSRYIVLEMCDDRGVSEIDVIDGLFSARVQDLNSDGIFEITGEDKAYSYFAGDSFAASPIPSVVLSFDTTKAKFTPDRDLMLKKPV